MESTIYLLHHVANVTQRQTDQALQERLGVGLSQFRILLMIHEHSDDYGTIDQRRIADSLGQTEASISRQIKLLQESHMVATAVDPAEKRRHILHLTSKGLKMLHAAQEAFEQYEAPMIAALTDKQRAQLKDALSLLHDYTCAPGKPMACDWTRDIGAIYAGHEKS